MAQRFNMAAMKREFQKRPAYKTEVYRGFTIGGIKYFTVDNWPKGYTSLKLAREAVDLCLAVRATQERICH